MNQQEIVDRVLKQPELPPNVLPIKYKQGQFLPFEVLKQLRYWPERGQGIDLTACEIIFQLCGVNGKFAKQYMQHQPDDIHLQLEDAREAAYRIRSAIMDAYNNRYRVRDARLPGYITDTNQLKMHPEWAKREWSHQFCLDVFAAYDLPVDIAHMWWEVYHDRTDVRHKQQCIRFAFTSRDQIQLYGAANFIPLHNLYKLKFKKEYGKEK